MSKSGKTELDEKETNKMLASAIAEVAEGKIKQLETAISKETAPVIHKDDLRIALSSASVKAVADLEKNK